MMRRTLILSFLCCCALWCRGQFQPVSMYQSLQNDISGLLPLIRSSESTVYAFCTDNSWGIRLDTVQHYYRSNFLQQLYHPEIAAAGYRYVTITEPRRDFSANIGEQDYSKIISQWDAGLERAQTYETVYTFDKEGWLRGMGTEKLYPEGDGYLSDTSVINYQKTDDGGLQIDWDKNNYWSTTADRHGRGCTNNLQRHRTQEHKHLVIKLNKAGNPVRITADEQRQECDSVYPAKRYVKTIRYDEVGRPVYVSDSNSEYGGLTTEYLYEYTDLPAGRQPRQHIGEELHADVLAFLRESDTWRMLYTRRTVKGYYHYDQQLKKNVLHPDDPDVRRDTAWCLYDRAGRKVMEYDVHRSPAYTCYSRKVLPTLHAAQGTQVKAITPNDVQLVGDQQITVAMDTVQWNDYCIIKLLSQPSHNNYRTAEALSAEVKTEGLAVVQMAVTDKQGLTVYLKANNKTYKLAYR